MVAIYHRRLSSLINNALCVNWVWTARLLCSDSSAKLKKATPIVNILIVELWQISLDYMYVDTVFTLVITTQQYTPTTIN